MPRMQAVRLDRIVRRGHGEPRGVWLRELRPAAAVGFRVRHGCGPPGNAEVRRNGSAAAVSERRTLLASIPLNASAQRARLENEGSLQLAEGIRGREGAGDGPARAPLALRH